jgi:hypothetical protein
MGSSHNAGNVALKPCPFCGGPAEADSQQPFATVTNGRLGKQAAVYCAGACGATITLCKPDAPDLSSEEALQVVVEHWNRRTP